VAALTLLLCLCGCACAQEWQSAEEVIAFIGENQPESLDIRVLPFESVKQLVDNYPNVRFSYAIDLAGTLVDVEDAAANLTPRKAVKINAQDLYEKLSYLPNLQQLDLYRASLSSEEMALLFDSYPGIRFGFTVRVGSWKVRTDAGAFSTFNDDPPKRRWKGADFEDLRFCYQLKALDLGHNGISDLSFLLPLKDLRVLILADNRLTDISLLSHLPNLQYVELFLNDITDLSAFAGNENLMDLNICWNDAVDYTPLLSCPNLERVWYSSNGLTEEAQAALTAALPECQFIFTSAHRTSEGWRTHDRYKVVRKMFKSRTYIPFEDSTQK